MGSMPTGMYGVAGAAGAVCDRTALLLNAVCNWTAMSDDVIAGGDVMLGSR